MDRRPWWRRIADALEAFTDELLNPSGAQPQQQPPTPDKTDSGARRRSDHAEKLPRTTDEYVPFEPEFDGNLQREVYDMVMSWGPHIPGAKRRTNRRTIARGIRRMDDDELRFALTFDSDDWVAMATINPYLFGYH